MRWMTIAALLCACGGDSGGEVTCSRADRIGTYLMTFAERSGNCGPSPDQLVRLDPDAPLDPTCEIAAPDVWSADECQLERSVTCVTPDDLHVSGVMVSEQRDSDGEHITAIYSVTVRDGSGAALCQSTYDVDAVRQ